MKKPGVILLAVVLMTAGAACGKDKSSNGGSGGSATTAKAGLANLLPADIAKAGELKVGSDIEYPPVESFKEGTQQAEGIDVDLANAMGAELGVKVRFINDTDFAGIIAAMKAGRFDIVMSAMNDTAERRGQGVDFIDYFTSGTSILVKKGNPEKIASLDDLCGKSVAVQKGTTQETDTLPPQSQKCTGAGKGAIKVLSFEKDTDALQQVKIGRASAILEDSPVAGYNAKTAGAGADFQLTGTATDVGQYGIAVPATNTKLRDAMRAALKAVIADGTYDRVLAKWGATSGALKTAQLNGQA
jgi:polar amino acid transport system substrate-binding protein